MINVQGAIVTVLGCIGVMILFNGTLRRPVLTGSLAVTKPVLRAAGELAGTEPVKRLNAAVNEVKSVPEDAHQRASGALKELPSALGEGASILAKTSLKMTEEMNAAWQSGDVGKRVAPSAPDGSNALTIIPTPAESDPRVQAVRKAQQKALDRFRRGQMNAFGDDRSQVGSTKAASSANEAFVGYDPRTEEDRAKARKALERLRTSGSMKQ